MQESGTSSNLQLNQIVWIWVRPQQPDPGIIVQLLCDEDWDLGPLTWGSGSSVPREHGPVMVLVNGKIYAINRHRLWQTEIEAITVGPPFFLPEEVAERTVEHD
jgi:hypothetical protein